MATYIFNGECPSSIKQAFIDTYLQKLELVVETTADYKKSGIYSAERDDASKPIVIDWGDGTIEQIDGDVSQLVHEYALAGTFNVVVQNIKSYAASDKTFSQTSNWIQTISQNQYTLKEVIAIPDSIKSIEDYAFSNCYSLVSVTIPDSVTSIEYYAFQRCTSLTSVTIPDSVTSIGAFAFFYTNNMQTITFENKTKSQVQAMENYKWYANKYTGSSYSPTITFVCSDGDIVLNKSRYSGGGGSG